MNILLVGNGKWGKNYISTLNNFPEVNLTIATRQNWKQLVDRNPNGVIIATPPDSHIEIASYALKKDIPIMIEKPLALSLDEVKKLEGFAAPILVNYIHLFSDAYQKIKEIVEPEKITSITSAGYNDGPIRNCSSLWDYGPHDIAMILNLTKKMPDNVCAFEFKNENKSIFTIQMNYKSFFTTSTVGNGANKPCRSLHVDFNGITVSYNDKERSPHHTPPLTNALTTFIKAISGMSDERLGLDLSIKVTKTLELCQQFINESSVYK